MMLRSYLDWGVMSTAEIMAALREAERALDEAGTHADRAAVRVSRARDVVAHALRGSSPGQLLPLLDTVRGTLRAAAEQVEPARQSVLRTAALATALDLDGDSDVEPWLEQRPRPASRHRARRAAGAVLAVAAGYAVRRLLRRRKSAG
jgi:hypothetical protein